MAVFQCPECELRFAFATELDEHLEREHPRFEAETRPGADATIRAGQRQVRREKGSDRRT